MPGSGTNKSFTVFRSAAEEAEMKRDEHGWDNEGGHMSSTAGRVTRTQRTKLPYMVTLAHHQSDRDQALVRLDARGGGVHQTQYARASRHPAHDLRPAGASAPGIVV